MLVSQHLKTLHFTDLEQNSHKDTNLHEQKSANANVVPGLEDVRQTQEFCSNVCVKMAVLDNSFRNL